MKKLIIVGDNGLVGSHFTSKFSDQYSITGYNRTNSLKFSLPENFDALIYLAQSTDYKSLKMTNDLMQVNVSLLYQFLENAVGKTNKVIVFSTGSVYKFGDHKAVDEHSLLNHFSSNPYIASKLMGEEVTTTFKPYFKEIIIVRPFFIYGKGQKSNMLFSAMINNVKSGNTIFLNQNKGLIFNPVHSDDAADFIHYCLTGEFSGLNIFNLFGPNEVSLYDVVSEIESVSGIKAKISVKDEQVNYLTGSTVNHDFKSKVTIKVGLKPMLSD